MTELTTRERVDAALARIEPRTKAFIDGRFTDAADGRTFACTSPIDGHTVGHVAAGDAADVDRAVRAARTAFEDGRWSRLAPKARKRILLAVAEHWETHLDELALLETLDVGKPIGDSTSVDIPNAIGCMRWFAEAVDKLYDEVAPSPADVVATITREPMGVVGAVTPWNFALMISSWKLAPALAVGNSVVLKPAEQSPLACLRAAELAVEAGLPPGVLNVVPGYGETAGQALGRHMDVDCLAFTGSAEIGKLFLTYSGESNMKPVSLECGGKTPQIVLADAGDLDTIAEETAWGIFFNQGQVCNAGSRLLVQDRVHDALMDKVAAIARDITPGDPRDPATKLGALVDATQQQRVLDYIRLGREEGARLALGGDAASPVSGGCYVEPTIFDDVAPEMRIAREEIFGPVLSTLTFRDVDEAIRVGNATVYGLAASVWTTDIDTAHRMGKALRAGNVWINCWDGGDVGTPFGGYKQSGFGRDKSLHAIDKYVQLKTTWVQLRGG
jgi:acyl-CoA reductase-like NAD-dependent aldehyde dehydrogenase